LLETLMNKKPLILIGDGAFAEIAFEYFTHDSEFEVVAFSVEQPYLKRDTLFDRPVVAFEDIEKRFPPAGHHFFAALVYTQLNRLRTRLYRAAKAKGYSAASYISPRAFVWRNVRLGEHCFVFEGNVVQPFSEVGDNVVLWSGNHIGHHSRIGNHCFISSHVVISGFATIGESCFFGVNSTIADKIQIGSDCLIGAGALVSRHLGQNQLIKAQPGEVSAKVTARRYFQVDEPAVN
jgi:sugar O-acyltransferase (sialic acid O-acetyltransferase NeuD family)